METRVLVLERGEIMYKGLGILIQQPSSFYNRLTLTSEQFYMVTLIQANCL